MGGAGWRLERWGRGEVAALPHGAPIYPSPPPFPIADMISTPFLIPPCCCCPLLPTLSCPPPPHVLIPPPSPVCIRCRLSPLPPPSGLPAGTFTFHQVSIMGTGWVLMYARCVNHMPTAKCPR